MAHGKNIGEYIDFVLLWILLRMSQSTKYHKNTKFGLANSLDFGKHVGANTRLNLLLDYIGYIDIVLLILYRSTIYPEVGLQCTRD